LRVFARFFLSPAGAAVFLPASFLSTGAFPAVEEGALPAVGVVLEALGGILNVEFELKVWSVGIG